MDLSCNCTTLIKKINKPFSNLEIIFRLQSAEPDIMRKILQFIFVNSDIHPQELFSFYICIHLPDSRKSVEDPIHKASNYPELLPEKLLKTNTE